MTEQRVRVSVPTAALRSDLLALTPDVVDVTVWDMSEPCRGEFEIIVPPYMSDPAVLRRLVDVRARLVQSQSIGYDGVAEQLPPGMVFANAASVHESSTAELAMALILASQRDLPRYLDAATTGTWDPRLGTSLADRRVLVIGFGGVGVALADRLAPFEVDLTVVAARARRGAPHDVHGADELPQLLPRAEIVVLTVPLSPRTRHLVDARFLAALPDGALVVNVARGAVVDTDALTAEVVSGRLRAALDVTEPEPLGADHPLWRAASAIITPHVGGASSAMAPRMARLLRDQAERIRRGQEPLNIVIQT